MKKILGLDLGTASIGWAMVTEAENEREKAAILGCGSRVIPISAEEKDSFEKGKAITTNADRTLKRGMRRNLERKKQRRDNLRDLLTQENWICEGDALSENGSGSTYDTLRLRASAAEKEISLSELARVLLSINKKRGYKSSRKTDSGEDGQLIDGMGIAKDLAISGKTPAEYALAASKDGKLARLDFYRSDLENEYNKIWEVQKSFFPEILTDQFKAQLSRQGKSGASKVFFAKYGINTADNKGKDRKVIGLEWRVKALTNRLDKEQMAYVICDLRGEIQNTSGYLGEISDRSKELFFNGETVGQYLYRNICNNSGFSTKNKVFYRQDYIDEFNKIWEVQMKFHPELTEAMRQQIANRIIFYQRPLKSQKGLVSFCEFESRPIKVLIDGKEKTRTTGSKVAPKSSPMFQEFKVLQILNNLIIKDRRTDETRRLTDGERHLLSFALSVRDKMKATEALKSIQLDPRRFELNYKELEGNTTLFALFSKFIEIVNLATGGDYDLSKLSYDSTLSLVKDVFNKIGGKTDLLSFDSSLPKEAYEQQPLFKLWHLLYSYEGDNSVTGTASLIRIISELTGLNEDYSKIIAGISFKDDYASLSHKAIKKILPFLKQGLRYDEACAKAGYNHSHSQTKEEVDNKILQDTLLQLPKGALRNPVVEKVINQMINVVNAAAQEYGKPDEIHIELARELKSSAKEREKATSDIQANNKRNQDIEQILKTEFNIQNVRKNDILRYRLYEELKNNGFKTLYSNKYIPKTALFSKDIDIEHIIPQALMFDDSFSNKTLEYKDINIEKGRKTANDYVKDKYGDEYYSQYCQRVNDLMERGIISKTKRKYLLMPEADIPSGFVDRDLRNSQYIAVKAREILEDYVGVVLPTTGSVTARLREEWQLVNVLEEINFDKYDKIGKTYTAVNSDGSSKTRIKDWTKRCDHRHHAMDAITIAFTKPQHIQILNNLRAKCDNDDEFRRLLDSQTTDSGRKRIFTPPMPLDHLRAEARQHLEAALVSIKAKNKVVTRNVNKTRKADGTNAAIELTPRGALHKEQVYGKRRIYEVFYAPVNAKMTLDTIDQVASKRVRGALLARLNEFGGDSKMAFSGKNSLEKNPIYLDSAHISKVQDKVKCVRFKDVFSIRKELSPDLSLDKVLDKRVRARIEDRIKEFDGDIKAALANLDINPIWLDDNKTIPIKRVTIGENFDLCAIRNKRDKDGKSLLDAAGQPIPNDYVNLRNNHHVALYIDADGNVQESVVPLFEALNRVSMGLPVVDKSFHSDLGWKFLFSLKVNEMFVFPDEASGFNPKEIDLLDEKNAAAISPHLFRVQKLSKKDYWFRHHLETTINNDDKELRDITWKRIQTIQQMANAVKVRINHIGKIVAVGEYD